MHILGLGAFAIQAPISGNVFCARFRHEPTPPNVPDNMIIPPNTFYRLHAVLYSNQSAINGTSRISLGCRPYPLCEDLNVPKERITGVDVCDEDGDDGDEDSSDSDYIPSGRRAVQTHPFIEPFYITPEMINARRVGLYYPFRLSLTIQQG